MPSGQAAVVACPAQIIGSSDAHFLAPHVEDAPWDLMQPAVGSTIESTGTGCSTAAMTSERRADETQVVTGCARGPDKGSRLGLGTLGAAHSPDKTVPSRSGSGGRAPSRSGFFALYHPSEPSPAQPEQNLPREVGCVAHRVVRPPCLGEAARDGVQLPTKTAQQQQAREGAPLGTRILSNAITETRSYVMHKLKESTSCGERRAS